MTRHCILVVSIFCIVGWAVAQVPEAPRPLPVSITGQAPPAPPAAPPPADGPMLAKFEPIISFPPETQQAVFGLRSGAGWLARRQLAHGRFMFGVNPAIKAPIEGDSDYRQAIATWGFVVAARSTDDPKLTAMATQAVLSLLASCKDDPADPACRVPMLAAGQGNRVGFAASLCLAILQLHNPKAPSNESARMLQEADKLGKFMLKQQQADGSIACGDDADAEQLRVYPGLALQAFAGLLRHQSSSWAKEPLLRGLTHYREVFRKQPHPTLAGTMLPACVECCMLTGNADSAAMALEMADWLCASQAGKSDARLIQWAGSFRTSSDPQGEPGFESAHATRGLACACLLLHQRVGDLTRYAKYRPATSEAIEFLRGLQYSPENTTHFEPNFRNEYLLGGTRVSVNQGNIRADATALIMLAFHEFLQSGAAEKR